MDEITMAQDEGAILSTEQATQQGPELGAAPARRRLGRGLNSLLGGVGGPTLAEGTTPGSEVPAGEFAQIPVGEIARNPYQPRKNFDPAELESLKESVATHGILQPLIVRIVEGGYQLIAGERRLLAAKQAGLERVPCRVVEMDDKSVCEVAIIENVQRTDLSELEKAQAFEDYLFKFSSSIEELARRLGKDRSTVSNCLRLLELPDFVKLALQENRITAGHARSLLPLEEEADQIAMCQRIVSEELNVREAEEEVRLKGLDAETIPLVGGESGSDSKGKKSSKSPRLSNHVLELQRQLREVVGAKVEIRLKGKNAGKMIIHFNTNDEFERIVGFLRKAA